MRQLQFDRLLAGTALALALVLCGQPGQAQTVSGVPVPDTDQLPPISASDISTSAVPAAALPSQAIAPVPAAEPAQAATPVTAPVETAAPAKPAEAAPVKAASNIDDMVIEKLRDFVSGKIERSVTRKNERTAAENFYRERKYAPLWITDGKANDRAKAAIGYLATVDRDGLDPSEYPAPDFASAASDPAALAEAEVKLTAAVLTYARHALNGRVNYTRVSADIYFSHRVMEPQEVLAKLGESTDVAATLDQLEPQQPAYQALKKALADVRSGHKAEPEKKAEAKPHVQVPEGKLLRPGMKDARVAAVRKRLEVPGDKESMLYDAAVRDAVKAFQAGANLNADGNLGANTVKAMNGATGSASTQAKLGDPTQTIIVNMDRWRWMPRNLGSPYVVVNIPDYRLTVYKNDKTVWTTKIVVGKPGVHATPLTSAEMKFITVNPTWNVPPSIIQNEYLPALQEDPQALDRIGLKVVQDADGTVHISQPPGAGNALGRIRFNFPNKFLVYQHDTPDKQLFAREKRAYSHGCMRVENPLKYGEVLLSLVLPEEHYTQDRLQKMFGGSEININFPTSKYVQVHLTYQTAFVDDDGKLQLREDVYGRDATMIAQLRGSERKVADIAIERAANTSAKPVRIAPGTFGGNSGGYRGPSFLDWLFNDGPRAPPPQRGPQRGRVSSR